MSEKVRKTKKSNSKPKKRYTLNIDPEKYQHLRKICKETLGKTVSEVINDQISQIIQTRYLVIRIPPRWTPALLQHSAVRGMDLERIVLDFLKKIVLQQHLESENLQKLLEPSKKILVKPTEIIKEDDDEISDEPETQDIEEDDNEEEPKITDEEELHSTSDLDIDDEYTEHIPEDIEVR